MPSLFICPSPHACAQGDNYNVYGLKGTRVIDSMAFLVAEFGKPEKGYYDDTIAITLVNRRQLAERLFGLQPKAGRGLC